MKYSKEYYQKMKRRARAEAVDYSNNFEEIMEKSYISLSEWTDHFRKLGKRYGLIQEFTENGII